MARGGRGAGVYCEIAPFNAAEQAFERLKPKGIIFSGGPSSVTSADSPRAPQLLFDSGLPLLGICYGQQTLHQQLGGKVANSDPKEVGRALIAGGRAARRPTGAAGGPPRPTRRSSAGPSLRWLRRPPCSTGCGRSGSGTRCG